MKNESIFKDITEVNLLMCKVLVNRYKKLNLNVTPLQSRIIMCLYNKKDDSCQEDLKKAIGCNKSTLSSVLSTMEKNGFIERKGSKDDIRKNSITLTQSSLEIVHILQKDHNDIDKMMAMGVSEEELASFRLFLDKVKKNLERI